MQARRLHDSMTGADWVRVDAKKAGSMFKAGHDVCMCPVNLHPFSPWRPCCFVNVGDQVHAWELERWGASRLWQTLVNYSTAYGCADSETGRYLAYYVRA